jgi:hypothetical protein
MLSWFFVMSRERGSAGRQHDPKDGSAGRAALYGDVATVHVDSPLGDGEPEAGAATLPGPSFVNPEEAIEDPVAVLDGNP